MLALFKPALIGPSIETEDARRTAIVSRCEVARFLTRERDKTKTKGTTKNDSGGARKRENRYKSFGLREAYKSRGVVRRVYDRDKGSLDFFSFLVLENEIDSRK